MPPIKKIEWRLFAIMENNVAVIKGKKKREELGLPHMTYIVADDWMDKLGYESFCLWLKLHTMVDRTDANRDYDRVPRSFENIYEKVLNISKSKFYRLIKPLWEFGLIDIVEWNNGKNSNATRPNNIIVYEYPFHEIPRKYQPLEKLRDWKTDYNSASKKLGETGGRPKSDSNNSNVRTEPNSKKPEFKKVNNHYRFKIKTLIKSGVSKVKLNRVSKLKHSTVSKMKPINVSNAFNNSSNTFNNSTNISIKDGIEKLNLPLPFKETLIDKIDIITKFEINILEIEKHYSIAKGKYSENEYNFVLFELLTKMTQRPNSFAAVMYDWLGRNQSKSNDTPKQSASKHKSNVKPIRTELLPDWFDKEDKEQPEQSKQEKVIDPDLVQKKVAFHQKYIQANGGDQACIMSYIDSKLTNTDELSDEEFSFLFEERRKYSNRNSMIG